MMPVTLSWPNSKDGANAKLCLHKNHLSFCKDRQTCFCNNLCKEVVFSLSVSVLGIKKVGQGALFAKLTKFHQKSKIKLDRAEASNLLFGNPSFTDMDRTLKSQ